MILIFILLLALVLFFAFGGFEVLNNDRKIVGVKNIMKYKDTILINFSSNEVVNDFKFENSIATFIRDVDDSRIGPTNLFIVQPRYNLLKAIKQKFDHLTLTIIPTKQFIDKNNTLKDKMNNLLLNLMENNNIMQLLNGESYAKYFLASNRKYSDIYINYHLNGVKFKDDIIRLANEIKHPENFIIFYEALKVFLSVNFNKKNYIIFDNMQAYGTFITICSKLMKINFQKCEMNDRELIMSEQFGDKQRMLFGISYLAYNDAYLFFGENHNNIFRNKIPQNQSKLLFNYLKNLDAKLMYSQEQAHLFFESNDRMIESSGINSFSAIENTFSTYSKIRMHLVDLRTGYDNEIELIKQFELDHEILRRLVFSNNYRKDIAELLGEKKAQFLCSCISNITDSSNYDKNSDISITAFELNKINNDDFKNQLEQFIIAYGDDLIERFNNFFGFYVDIYTYIRMSRFPGKKIYYSGANHSRRLKFMFEKMNDEVFDTIEDKVSIKVKESILFFNN